MADPVPKSQVPYEGTSRIPTKIGRYDVLERLGSGSTGTVYRATDPFIGRILAIKTFRVDLEPGPQRDRFLQRFYHEARISGGLSHPNIVALFDVGEMDGLPYLVFEHVEGPTLDVALARNGRLDSAETIRVVEQAAAALDFAHVKGVVHRDIRPANIILALDKRVRIADFGIARVEGSQLTQHGEILGTPAYMSPEQIRGYELSAESDLFSLAVCAYEMLSGQRPFVGKSQPELLEALVYSPPVEPKELRALGIPSRDFMFVFERALAKDPSHRFADAASFARALKSCLGVAAPEEVPPASRIALPETPAAPRRSILPPVSPPRAVPPPVVDEAPAQEPENALVQSEASPQRPPGFDTAATAAIESASTGLEPKFISSSDATMVSTASTEPGGKSVPKELSTDAVVATAGTEPGSKPVPTELADKTSIMSPPDFDGGATTPRAEVADSTAIMETVGFGKLNARELTEQRELADQRALAEQRALADQSDVTMTSPLMDSEPAPRLSREAVESLLSQSAPSQPTAGAPPAVTTPMFQKTLPGADKLPTSTSAASHDAPKLPVSPSLHDTRPGRDQSPLIAMARRLDANPANQSGQGPADRTMIMTESEKASAAKQRVPDRTSERVPDRVVKVPSAPPPPPRPAPPQTQRTGAVARPATASIVPMKMTAPPRSSMVPKILIAAVILMSLLALALGAMYLTRASRGGGAVAERWNELPVYPESEVEKSPLLYSHELPKPKLAPGQVVSVTVSWIVTTDGLVDDPKIITSASPEIDAEMVEAVRKWRYEPGQKDGKTVPVRVLRRYTFPQRGSSQGS